MCGENPENKTPAQLLGLSTPSPCQCGRLLHFRQGRLGDTRRAGHNCCNPLFQMPKS